MNPPSIHCDLIGTTTRFYDTGKYRTRAIEVENDKMPVILMHGGGGHAEAFARNMIPMSEFCRPIAVDFIWHGLSSAPKFSDGKPRTRGHWLAQFTDQILEFLDHRGIKKAVFEGESLGGWIAADIGLNHPERAAGIVFNTAWGMVFDPAKVKEDKGDLQSLLKSSLDALNNLTDAAIRRRMEWLMPLGGTTEEIIEVRKRIWGREQTRKALIEYYEHLFDPSTDEALFTEADIAKIKTRTLALWTTHNPFQGVDAARRIVEVMPNASLHVIENAGHWPQWEKPQEHDRAVRDFLKTL